MKQVLVQYKYIRRKYKSQRLQDKAALLLEHREVLVQPMLNYLLSMPFTRL
jgi:hypothetical protein